MVEIFQPDGGGGGGTIEGTINTNQVAFGTALDTIGGSTDLTYNDSTKVLSFGSGVVTFNKTLSGASATNNFLNITGTLNSTNTQIANGVSFSVTGAGTSALSQRALSSILYSGYTGSAATFGTFSQNQSAGTGATLWTGGAFNAGFGTSSISITIGHNVGNNSTAFGSSTLNVGIRGNTTNSTNSPALNIAVVGQSLNATTNVAGFFGLTSTAPTFGTSAALIADNGATGFDIFQGRVNGTIEVSIDGGGKTGFGMSPIDMVSVANNTPTLVTNGTFNGNDTSWTTTTGWAYNTNKETHTTLNAGFLSQPITLIAGHKYMFSFNISGWTTGVVEAGIANAGFNTYSSTDYPAYLDISTPNNQNYSVSGTSANSGTYYVYFDPTQYGSDLTGLFDGSVTNITVIDLSISNSLFGVYPNPITPSIKALADGNVLFGIDDESTLAGSPGWIFNFNNTSVDSKILFNANTPLSSGNGTFGMNYKNNNQFLFGFLNGAGSYISFNGSGSSAQLNGTWNFPSNSHYPADVLLTSINDSTDDTRWRITNTGAGASQIIKGYTQTYADNVIQPELWLQAQRIQFYVRGGNVSTDNIGTGTGTNTLALDIAPTTGNIGIGGTATTSSRVNIQNLPTSSAGLATGDLWIDTTGGSNIIKIK